MAECFTESAPRRSFWCSDSIASEYSVTSVHRKACLCIGVQSNFVALHVAELGPKSMFCAMPMIVSHIS